ncbi:MAG: hypothetical protein MUF34_07750 [Polyangiaceae bacterium]|jgi:hypothetical protein|nr:hypothetical protein [Polyangiaceae bacterium]
MLPARSVPTPLPVGAAIDPASLRAALETRRARGDHFSLSEAVALLVPLCLELSGRHAAGEAFVVHPSSLRLDHARLVLPANGAPAPALLPRDRACLAPEERQGGRGDERASVFSVGAMLYELLTGESVGPGMRRAVEVKAGLPATVDVLLGQALIADASARPSDLRALAAALHQLSPDAASGPPPSADASQLEVDVSLSMMPPPPKAMAAAAGAAPARPDPTSRLAELKARLEGDPRPRYVVVRDGIDHGPFNGVELLQQIGRHAFHGDDVLRDVFSKDERVVQDWDEFAPFAEQAKLHRDVKAEKAAMERTIVAEKKATVGKALAGGGLLAVLVGVAIVWVVRERGARSDEVTIEGDRAVSVEVQGGTRRPGKPSPNGGPGRAAPAGGYPSLPGGLSCEGAQARYVEEMRIGEKGPADLTASQFGAVLNNGSYLNACGVPPDTKVNVCAAVQNGRAVGVTVTTNPRNPSIESCVAGRVRSLGFPSNPRLDITRTTF